MASLPLAIVAFLLLLFGVTVNAGEMVSSNLICLNADAPECESPVNEGVKALCCPSDRPICTSFMGRLGCYSPDVTHSAIAGRDARDTLPGYPFPDGPTTTISADDPNYTGGPFMEVSGSLVPVAITGDRTLTLHSPSVTSSKSGSTVLVVTKTVTVTEAGTHVNLRAASSSESSQPVFETYPWPTSNPYTPMPFTSLPYTPPPPVVTKTITVTGAPSSVAHVNHQDDCSESSQPVFKTYPWPTPNPYTPMPFTSLPYTPRPQVTTSVEQAPHTLAARDGDVTSVPTFSDKVAVVQAMGSSTTFPLTLITDNAAVVPTSCWRYLSSTSQADTTTWLTYVARDCTDVTPTASDTMITIQSTATTVAPTTSTESTSTESYSHCFVSSRYDECDSLFSPTATISSTSTSTSMSFIQPPVNGVAAGQSSLSSSSAAPQTTATITTTDDACGDPRTVYVTIQATPPSVTFTSWILTTTSINSTSSSIIIVSDASTHSWTSVESSTSADAVSAGNSSIAMSMPTPVIPIPTTPFTTLTPITPGSPTPTVFNGGSETVKGGKFSGLLAIITLTLVLFFQ